MPKKETQPVETPAEQEDPPIVKELKELDDKYLELKKACDKEVEEIYRKYTAQQQPLMNQRKDVLCKGENSDTGTPACSGFWVQAMQNHPAFDDFVQKWDVPVLEYLTDITTAPLDPVNSNVGFKLSFHFAKNAFFDSLLLEKEYRVEEDSPYTAEFNVTEIKSTEICWNDGKDVTVEKVAKKVKGGGAKKNKQKQAKEEPRESFFRDFFRNLKPGDPVPEDMNLELDSDEDEDDDDMMEMIMDRDHEMGQAIKEQLIPFAVRWYTGEAAPDMDDDDDDEDEESEDEDDDDEDDSPVAKKKSGKSGAKPAAVGKGEGGEQQECKQQ